MKRVHLTALVAAFATLAVGCGAEHVGGPGSEPESDRESLPSSDGNGGDTKPSEPDVITWCNTALNRTGTIAGTSLDYPSTPDTTWFNTSLEQVALSSLDEAMMEAAGLDPHDDADVERFRYFAHGFDFRWIVGDQPSPGNWFGKTDFSVYLFDLAEKTIDTSVTVFDASAVRDARLSGDKKQLASAIRVTVDAMKADPHPKAIIAFAPDRNPETSLERAFISMFARNVYFATTGSVTLSNLRDVVGAPLSSVVYPIRNLRTLDVSASGEIAGTPFSANGSCLDLRISG